MQLPYGPPLAERRRFGFPKAIRIALHDDEGQARHRPQRRRASIALEMARQRALSVTCSVGGTLSRSSINEQDAFNVVARETDLAATQPRRHDE